MPPSTAFSHRAVGTSEPAWTTRFAVRPALPELATPGARVPVVVLAAHPDDETLGAGGLIHRAARAGVRVTVIVATDGEASHPDSGTHDPVRLARIRRSEVAAAVAELSADATLHRLGRPDSALADDPDGLAAAVLRLAPDAGLLVAPWAGDRHPDHEACGQAALGIGAAAGIPVWQYPIWMWHWADPDGDDVPWTALARLPLDDADRAAKRCALDRHVSQHRPLSDEPGDEPVLPDPVLDHFRRPFETFVVTR